MRVRDSVNGKERCCEVRVAHEVPFHDVDALGIVWHGHYYKYFELARTALLRSLRLDGPWSSQTPARLLVTDSGCRYIQPLSYGDRIEIAAWIHDYLHRLRIDYEIVRAGDGRRSARGHTVLACTDEDGRLLLRTPEAVRRRIRAVAEEP